MRLSDDTPLSAFAKAGEAFRTHGIIGSGHSLPSSQNSAPQQP